ncbi:MAG: hypothetical protein HQL03_13590 [Nitrospirae bacterium]|nr:hypothetical protein [Nitrospirota bacterium]
MNIMSYIIIATMFMLPSMSWGADAATDNKTLSQQQQAAEAAFLGFKPGVGIMANFFGGHHMPVKSAQVINLVDASGKSTGNIVRVEDISRASVGVAAEFHKLWCIGGKDVPAVKATKDNVEALKNNVKMIEVQRSNLIAQNSNIDDVTKQLSETQNKLSDAQKELNDSKFIGCNGDVSKAAQWGVGPSVALVLGDSNGSGNVINSLFIGPMFAFRPDITSSSSFNIAVGATISPSVQVLGGGISDGQPLPAGETSIRYKKESKGGFGVLLSFAW